MIEFKQGVNAHSVHPAIWVALGIAHNLRRIYSGAPLVVTAMADTSGHMVGSYHYPASTPTGMCQAIDLRTADLSEPSRIGWAADVHNVLYQMGYDVVNESPETTGKALHLHIEYQPHQASTDWASYLTGPSGDYSHGNTRT